MGGLAWSNDLSKWLQYAPYLKDPLKQSAATWHCYANNACNRQSCWDKTIKTVARVVPVVVTEMGHGVQWAQGSVQMHKRSTRLKIVSLNCGCLVWYHISIHVVSIIYVRVFVCFRSGL